MLENGKRSDRARDREEAISAKDKILTQSPQAFAGLTSIMFWLPQSGTLT